MMIYNVTGNKGGCGKSLISSLITDFIYRQSVIEEGVVEMGNGIIPPKPKDVKLFICDCDRGVNGQLTYTRQTNELKDTSNVTIVKKFYDIESANGFASMFDEFIEQNADYAIIDSGCGMLAGLNDNSVFLNDLSKELSNINFKNIFVTGTSSDSTDAAQGLLEHFFKCKHISTTYVLNHLDPNKDFDISNDELVNDKIKEYNSIAETEGYKARIDVVDYQYIPVYIFNMMNLDKREVQLPYSILHNNKIGPAKKLMFKVWLAESDKLIREIL